jgi:hypothetical protein
VVPASRRTVEELVDGCSIRDVAHVRCRFNAELSEGRDRVVEMPLIEIRENDAVGLPE